MFRKLDTLSATAKARLLAIACGMIALIAVVDRAIGNRASLGLLYIVPMIVAGSVLPPVHILTMAVVCSSLRAWFDLPAPAVEVFFRFVFALMTYAGSGLAAVAFRKIRLEQELRQEAEEQLRILVGSSPAAILTLDRHGVVVAANHAANKMIKVPDGETLKGQRISAYLPVLESALEFEPGPEGLRTAAQCQASRANGEIFLANIWFSTWAGAEGRQLAAIVVDTSEEMRDREEENLRQLLRGNEIAAAAVSHEVRNFCSAISVIANNLTEKKGIIPDGDIQSLTSLAKGLERIASLDLRMRAREPLPHLDLRQVLDDLRIVIEPQWREIGGIIRWKSPPSIPVVGERHGLLQVFLNLAQNSRRAVQDLAVRELSIVSTVEMDKIVVRFHDSGPGIASPETLFAPFQPDSNGSGLGLYVSRAVIRSYGGDLRWDRTGFAVDLQPAPERGNN